jgi:hypothetical protein
MPGNMRQKLLSKEQEGGRRKKEGEQGKGDLSPPIFSEPLPSSGNGETTRTTSLLSNGAMPIFQARACFFFFFKEYRLPGIRFH